MPEDLKTHYGKICIHEMRRVENHSTWGKWHKGFRTMIVQIKGNLQPCKRTGYISRAIALQRVSKEGDVSTQMELNP